MAELGCQLDQVPLRSGDINRARDASPDSVIFTLESNFSLFSSASASVDRCSFASDAHDQDSLASELSHLHLTGHESGGRKESWSSGQNREHPDPNKLTTAHNKKHPHSHSSSRLSRKAEKAKVQKEENIATTSAKSTAIEEDVQLLDSARSSFSLALKECRDRRSRSEANFEKPDRRRPASLDLNNVVAESSSPRLGGMNKSSISSRRSSGTCPSPGTPNYRYSGVGMQKGWSSERVPLYANGNRRQVSAALLPLNSGKTLPSKWEDAERWILSPVPGDGAVRVAQFPPPQRRPKSKSGPLGPPGVAYYSMYSPAMQVFDGGNVGSFLAGSPFSPGVIAADGLAIRSKGHGLPFTLPTEPCMARSVSVHGCSELIAESSLPSHGIDEKHEGVKDAATDISHTVSRRDMATQMSPEGSNHSSPCRRPSFSASTLSALPIVEVRSIYPSKSEERDVQVDERVTLTRWSKRHRPRNSGKTSDIVDDWRKKALDVRSSARDISETAKSISKVKREEAKLTAWENLQRAKAEAAIRKLEMKLEKKRSSSMDKIMNKLRSAQKRAQEMRSSVLADHTHQVSWTPRKAISFRKTRQMTSLSGCFTCHAF
uniref:Remorin C-terminal domain-containing protein n=2 Tax=Rhizophora mucronata TaxID=61149 RepID=A0A2P2JG16_RHIMU